MSRRRQSGVALMTALLVMALLGTLAISLAWDNGMDVRRTYSMLYHDEGSQAALGAENWVASILRDDAVDTDTDHLGEIWAQELPVLPIESDTIQGAIQGEIEDLQGRFNINNLVDSGGQVDQDALAQFERLLVNLGLDPRFAGLAADWLDADQDAVFPNGAEDQIYTGMIPPYRSADQRITSITELMALEGMDKATFDTLAPHISALPGSTGINVNTATAAVLGSLDEGLSPNDIESMIAEREDGGFTDFQNYFQTLVPAEVLDTLEETSSFFQLKVVVQIDTVRVTYYSVLYRDPATGTTTPILRSFGTI